jgi:hypothetical protein
VTANGVVILVFLPTVQPAARLHRPTGFASAGPPPRAISQGGHAVTGFTEGRIRI